MNPDVAKYIEDIRISIEAIESHMAGIIKLHQYENDLKTIDSVERRLAIIGEALFKAEKLEKNLPVSNLRKIIGLRHILVHDYDLINDSTIFLIVKNDLPALKSEVENILNNIS
ncbi:MAG TPA: DUF86 domain-containing protein [Panacibacter sp.]|nr:DUF86 domain-containing protein [Panacibacter sp.]